MKINLSRLQRCQPSLTRRFSLVPTASGRVTFVRVSIYRRRALFFRLCAFKCGSHDDELVCKICDEYLVDPVVTPCEHSFGCDCITPWLRTKNTSPVCRATLPGADSLGALLISLPRCSANFSILFTQKRSLYLEWCTCGPCGSSRALRLCCPARTVTSLG